MKKFITILSGLSLSCTMLFAADVYISDTTKVPELTMKDTGLTFQEIQGYQNYKIGSTQRDSPCPARSI